MGNIGDKPIEIEFDPSLTEPAPVHEPAAPERAPEPVAPQPEKVPA